MGRRELREHIFRLLFRTEFHSEAEMTEQEVFYLNDLGEISDEDRTYIQGKVDAIRGKKVDLDSRIDGVADKWKTERMTKVDLTIIRPTGVAINEAVELAKRYGTDQSPAFVNAVLAKLA